MQDDMTERTELAYTLESEPVWIHDEEGELVFFALVEQGQVTEWVWL
jgi:hypothetical protein